ncbi:MAG TPA: GNAT family N-acetyltransferase [Candidatus Hydrogenedentes bacterium]|nr:GNAT family N-acetyltransferase [Candidatus Hydrogenedentota bacterium]HIJ73068.1 GNAT family N-acetyltransferase [Candidatus Hydrogenedentota bacterium]
MRRPEDTCIRRFRDTDVASVAQLIHRTIDACYTGVYPPRAVQFFKEFHSPKGIRERSQKGDILVIEQRGEVIGTGAVVDNEIYGVFVAPTAQGRGHGKDIMHELETRARARGVREVTLSVSLPSRKFYEHLGYEIREEAFIDVGQGERLDFWKATKRL